MDKFGEMMEIGDSEHEKEDRLKLKKESHNYKEWLMSKVNY